VRYPFRFSLIDHAMQIRQEADAFRNLDAADHAEGCRDGPSHCPGGRSSRGHPGSDPDETSNDGVRGQTDVNPASDPETHLPVNLVVTPLSNIDGDANIYDLPASSVEALALRAFRGALGAHAGIRDKSPKWENKTRRYFKHLIRALESGKFRSPQRPVVTL
jgi:hypothetical protein